MLKWACLPLFGTLIRGLLYSKLWPNLVGLTVDCRMGIIFTDIFPHKMAHFNFSRTRWLLNFSAGCSTFHGTPPLPRADTIKSIITFHHKDLSLDVSITRMGRSYGRTAVHCVVFGVGLFRSDQEQYRLTGSHSLYRMVTRHPFQITRRMELPKMAQNVLSWKGPNHIGNECTYMCHWYPKIFSFGLLVLRQGSHLHLTSSNFIFIKCLGQNGCNYPSQSSKTFIALFDLYLLSDLCLLKRPWDGWFSNTWEISWYFHVNPIKK